MTAKTQLAGVADFLHAVYGPDTRVSTLLARDGYSESQLVLLRGQHLDGLLRMFVTAIAARITLSHNGERKVFILVRRFGLDGQPRATLQDLATRLDISRERVRQVEESVLRRCRSRQNRAYWPEALNAIARSLVVAAPESALNAADPPGEAAPVVPFPLAPIPGPKTSAYHGVAAVAESRPTDLATAVAAVLDATGERLGDYYLAKVLGGDHDPISDALVMLHRLDPYQGSFAGEDRSALQLRIHEIRVARLRAALGAEMLAHAVQTVVDAVGSGLSDFYLAAILIGESGPTTAALVGHYHLESMFGVFAADRKALEVLVREARASLPLAPAACSHARTAAAAVAARVDRRLRAEYIARVLVGERGPIVEALVRRYGLDSFYGSCADLDRDQLAALVRTVRLGGAPTARRSRSARPAPGPTAHDPTSARLHELIQTIQRRTGDLSFWMYAHILYGSTGPVVEGLVAAHGLQEYGLLRDVGFNRVKHLVQEALRQSYAPSSPAPISSNDLSTGQRALSAPAQAEDSWSQGAGPALLERLRQCGEALPALDDVRQFLELRKSDPSAGLERWLRVNRGRAVASWLWLEDGAARSGALPGEIGAMCCQLAPLAARESDPDRKTRLSDAILLAESAGVDHIGIAPLGVDLEQLRSAFAALTTRPETLAARDLWLRRLTEEHERQYDSAPDRRWYRFLSAR